VISRGGEQISERNNGAGLAATDSAPLLYNLPVNKLLLTVLAVFLLMPVIGGYSAGQSSSVRSTGFDSNLRGFSAGHEDRPFLWASGTNGTVLRSVDEGKSWKKLEIEGGADLDFRDIDALDANTAYLMSSGEGDKSRIFKTSDGGQSWALQFTDKRPGFFLDSLACDYRNRCFALSDPVEGKFLVLAAHDGQHWEELPRDKMPAALPGESAFAASGTSIALCQNNLYFGTGGPVARIFRSTDSGRSWTAVETPVASGNASSGIFSVACRGQHVVAVGGDYKEPDKASNVAIYSKDFGAHWTLAPVQPHGYRSSVICFSFSDDEVAAVGPNGIDYSLDGGVRWTRYYKLNMNAAGRVGNEAWAVGPHGTFVRLVPQVP
jgi:photosystem II stability/assembly factor-like uncharacterized protein